MKNFSKYICANILSLIGNLGLFIFLLATFGGYNIQGKAWTYMEENCGIWFFAIAKVLIALFFDILINKFLHDKFTTKLQLKNEIIKNTYNILFWLGIICSLLYFMLYLWFVTR